MMCPAKFSLLVTFGALRQGSFCEVHEDKCVSTNVILLQDTFRGKKTGCFQDLMASEIPS